MKTVNIDETSLDSCVQDAQRERIVVTRKGIPVVLIVGIEGMDEEQLQLGSSDEFWRLITERRQQKTIGSAELRKRIKELRSR